MFIETPLIKGMILESVNSVKCNGLNTLKLLRDATGEITIIAKLYHENDGKDTYENAKKDKQKSRPAQKSAGQQLPVIHPKTGQREEQFQQQLLAQVHKQQLLQQLDQLRMEKNTLQLQATTLENQSRQYIMANQLDLCMNSELALQQICRLLQLNLELQLQVGLRLHQLSPN